ncbi:hypothetical protein E9229_003153 [Paeniglutamicibacter cryotolerans]|uniref:Uncharacterized protein n=1 Tax=Paeniglutamicibacter cryotolerans TaxID=670079 RepID=A0A839QSG5_9MICC|nr:hypothetical protein [Paeniglutamicibacter cryotolerans]
MEIAEVIAEHLLTDDEEPGDQHGQVQHDLAV